MMVVFSKNQEYIISQIFINLLKLTCISEPLLEYLK